MLKFSEQMGTPQHVATSSSLTAHLRSLSKGDSPVGSPFQNYSSIHSQSRSVSSPSMQSRSPSISNMAALRWVLNVVDRQTIPKNTSYGIGCTSGIAVCLSLLLQVCPAKVQVPPLLQHLKALLKCPCDTWCAIIPIAQEGNWCARAKEAVLSSHSRSVVESRTACRSFESQECFRLAFLKKAMFRGNRLGEIFDRMDHANLKCWFSFF